MTTGLAKGSSSEVLTTSQRKDHLIVGVDDKEDRLIVNKHPSTRSARLRTESSDRYYYLS